MKVVKVGMAQILVEGGRAQANLDRACKRIAEARQQNCDVILLPECLDLGWTHPSATELAVGIPGPHSDVLARAARRFGIHVVAGLVERDGETLFNTAILLAPDGRIILKHRKIHELDFARELYTAGTSLGVEYTPFGCIGIPICADNFPDTLDFSRALIRMGADLLLSPCAWAVAPDFEKENRQYGTLWIDAYTKLAKEFGVPVIGVSNVGMMSGGTWDGHRCIGRSLAVGRNGRILAHLPFGADADVFQAIEVEIAA